MLEVIVHIFTDGIVSISSMFGNVVVRRIFPNGFIEQDSLLSGTIGFIVFLLILTIICIAIYYIA